MAEATAARRRWGAPDQPSAQAFRVLVRLFRLNLDMVVTGRRFPMNLVRRRRFAIWTAGIGRAGRREARWPPAALAGRPGLISLSASRTMLAGIALVATPNQAGQFGEQGFRHHEADVFTESADVEIAGQQG